MDDRKTNPDSWERLERDVRRVAETSSICGYFGYVNKLCGGCPALTSSKRCLAFALGDVLSRAKALAGVWYD